MRAFTQPLIKLFEHHSSLRLARAVGLRLEVLGGEGEPEDEAERVGVAVDAGGVQGRPTLHRQHRDEEREPAQQQLNHLQEREHGSFKASVGEGMPCSQETKGMSVLYDVPRYWKYELEFKIKSSKFYNKIQGCSGLLV